MNTLFASGAGSFSRLKLHQDDRLYHPTAFLNLMAVAQRAGYRAKQRIRANGPAHGGVACPQMSFPLTPSGFCPTRWIAGQR